MVSDVRLHVRDDGLKCGVFEAAYLGLGVYAQRRGRSALDTPDCRHRAGSPKN